MLSELYLVKKTFTKVLLLIKELYSYPASNATLPDYIYIDIVRTKVVESYKNDVIN